MDPISAIGVLASLSSLIETSNSVLKLVKGFKNGEKELLELYSDISVFEEALKGLDRVLRSRQTRHNVSGKVISSALEESYTTIQDLEKRLVQISNSEVSAIRRMKWAQNKSSLKKLHERLKEQSTMLQSFLALVHAETFLAVCSGSPQFLQLYPTVVDGIDSDISSPQDLIKSKITMLDSESLISSHRKIFADASSIVLGDSSVTSFDQAVGDSVQPEVGQKARVGGSSVDALEIRRACRYDCYCKCHAENNAISARGFQKLGIHKHPCTEPDCQNALQSDKKVVIPSVFFRKAILQAMSYKSIKVRYNLNTYRIVSEGSDSMRHVKHGNLGRLKMCIESGEATLWDTAPDGWSLLHNAAYYQQLPIVNYLLEQGADTEVADVGTRFATTDRTSKIAKLTTMKSKPADLAILKALAVHATHMEQEIVKVFSKRGDYISDFGFTPIHIAVLDLYDPTDLERPTLEQLIPFVDDANNAPPGTDWAKWKLKYRKRSTLYREIIELFRASASEKPKTSKVIHNLLDHKDRKYNWTPLHWASSAGRTDKMRILMNHGADPFILSNLNANILHAAVESKASSGLIGALEIWKRYPQQLNINQANRWAETPLHVAVWGSVECVKLLLEAGADPSARQEDQQVPLHCTGLSTRGNVRREVVSLLCRGESEPHINAQDVDGRPPIFEFLDDPECLELLINHGARLDLLDSSGKSLFHHACIQDESEALKTLLRLSPDSVMVTVKDHDGNSPLIQALCHGSVDAAMTLLELDNVGDIIGHGGWTAVHYAAKIGDANVLEAVLKHSSFVKGKKTIDGKTAEVVAMEGGNWCGKVKELLRKYNSMT